MQTVAQETAKNRELAMDVVTTGDEAYSSAIIAVRSVVRFEIEDAIEGRPMQVKRTASGLVREPC